MKMYWIYRVCSRLFSQFLTKVTDRDRLSRKAYQRGMTLVEIMVVVVIISLVAGVVGVRLTIAAGALVCAVYGAVVAVRYSAIRSTSPQSEAVAASS